MNIQKEKSISELSAWTINGSKRILRILSLPELLFALLLILIYFGDRILGVWGYIYGYRGVLGRHGSHAYTPIHVLLKSWDMPHKMTGEANAMNVITFARTLMM